MTLRDQVTKLAFENPGEIRDAILPLLVKQASRDMDDWMATFESLRKGQSVYIAMTATMGRSALYDGKYHEWKVGRKSKGRGYESIKLHPVGPADGSVPAWVDNVHQLWLRPKWRPELRVTISAGDMSLELEGLKT
jgi:hypothetical protein